jgi:hypothetical protein
MKPKLILTAAVFFGVTALRAEPVKVWSVNPHYFAFNEKPLVLITSDHHYGAVIDLDFDYVRYLDYLNRSGMNLTRIYPGGMLEAPDKYAAGNPLGPRSGRQILPWAISSHAGAHASLAEPGRPSYKYDLDHWNPEYFARLKSFVDLAGKKDIIVEVAFFNGMYEDCWPRNALYHANNIQNVGQYEASECGLFTTNDSRNQDVLRYQIAYISKVAAELNRFDNVIFDLCDEPSLHGKADGSVLHIPDDKVIPWLLELKDAFLEAERQLSKKHILGQTAQSLSPDMSRESWCDWIPAEYVRPAAAALNKDYDVRKPIMNVETDYYGVGLTKPYSLDDVRAEGWWFLLRGGAGLINLNGEFHRGQETGAKDTRDAILPQKRILRNFMLRFDLSRTEAFPGLDGVPADAVAAAIADPGRQYGIYIFHGRTGPHHFVTVQGAYQDSLTLKSIPKGKYLLEWIDPAGGFVKGAQAIDWAGGNLEVNTPHYSLDIALRLFLTAGPQQ